MVLTPINEAAAERNSGALLKKNPWMDVKVMEKRVERVMTDGDSLTSKRKKLIHIGRVIGETVAPHAACKQGCSHCCYQATTILQHEAEAIGKATGRTPKTLEGDTVLELSRDEEVARFDMVPCPFLVDHQCSVYEVRPLICRLHHSLDDNADQCDRSIPSAESSVPHYNTMPIVVAYTYLSICQGETVGDIRAYFP